MRLPPFKPDAAPIALAALLSTPACTNAGAASSGFATNPVTGISAVAEQGPAVHPMTTILPDGAGYFEDPYPVHLAPSLSGHVQVFSGTTQAIMSCTFPVSPRCFSWTPATIDTGTLGRQITAAGAHFTNVQNLDVFQDDAGHWHAVLAIGVNSPANPNYWTVLVHAHPATSTTPDIVPLAWSADTILSGSFSHRVDGNYDGKYLEDGGRLYLLYVRNFVEGPALRNGIVIQPMLSPTQLAPVGPTTLLTTGDRFGPLDSEHYDHTPAKLVEAPTIARIAGKYALIYSTGAYEHVDYKAGVAWSDTLMPPQGSHYRKVLQPDPQGIWGQKGPEVRYLLQSQHRDWPNFTGGRVVGPGVASSVQAPDGTWSLFFAGYKPGDDAPVGAEAGNAHHRRPYFVRLRVSVPAQPVATAPDGELATWLQPEVR